MIPGASNLRRSWGFAAGALGLVVLDALSKALVVAAFAGPEPEGTIWLAGGLLRLAPTHNTGTLFRILLPWLDPALAYGILFAAVSVLLFRHARARRSPRVRWGAVLVVAGGVGNLLDRIATGRVVDFLSLGVPGLDWRSPAFNLADVAICSGAALLLWGEIRHARPLPSRGARTE